MYYRAWIAILLLFVQNSLQDCVLYDHCFTSSSGKSLLCLYKGPPKTNHLTLSAQEIMLKRCSEIYSSPESPLCCSGDQVVAMETQFSALEAFVGRCSTCLQNMLKLFCAATCSPEHDKFLEVAASSRAVGNDSLYATATRVFVDGAYMRSTFESCKEVLVPSVGAKFPTISCGGSDGSCTAEQWYSFFGDPVNNGMCPFKISYINSKRPGRFKWITKPCAEPYKGYTACSCSDCPAVCPAPLEITSSGKTSEKAEVQRAANTIGLIFALFTVMGSFFWIRRITNFKQFGEAVTKHSWMILAISTVIILALGHNIANIKITTDPIKLWSSASSRARIEKDFFDRNFGPFFRTEQVILKPKNQSQIQWKINDKMVTFGPAFEWNFLRNASQLQKQLQDLKDERGRGLEKSCYSPFTDNATHVSQCLIQSIFGYRQNSFPAVDETDEENIDHLDDCLKYVWLFYYYI